MCTEILGLQFAKQEILPSERIPYVMVNRVLLVYNYICIQRL